MRRTLQPIAGVGGTVETDLDTVYPSIGATGLGRMLAGLYEALPAKLGRVKVAHLLFALPTAPLTVGLYLWLKVAGPRYRLTTHRLVREQSLTGKPIAEVPLSEIAGVDIVPGSHQSFFDCDDLEIRDRSGQPRLRLTAVPLADRVRHLILSSQDARVRVDRSAQQIAARVGSR